MKLKFLQKLSLSFLFFILAFKKVFADSDLLSNENLKFLNFTFDDAIVDDYSYFLDKCHPGIIDAVIKKIRGVNSIEEASVENLATKMQIFESFDPSVFDDHEIIAFTDVCMISYFFNNVADASMRKFIKQQSIKRGVTIDVLVVEYLINAKLGLTPLDNRSFELSSYSFVDVFMLFTFDEISEGLTYYIGDCDRGSDSRYNLLFSETSLVDDLFVSSKDYPVLFYYIFGSLKLGQGYANKTLYMERVGNKACVVSLGYSVWFKSMITLNTLMEKSNISSDVIINYIKRFNNLNPFIVISYLPYILKDSGFQRFLKAYDFACFLYYRVSLGERKGVLNGFVRYMFMYNKMHFFIKTLLLYIVRYSIGVIFTFFSSYVYKIMNLGNRIHRRRIHRRGINRRVINNFENLVFMKSIYTDFIEFMKYYITIRFGSYINKFIKHYATVRFGSYLNNLINDTIILPFIYFFVHKLCDFVGIYIAFCAGLVGERLKEIFPNSIERVFNDYCYLVKENFCNTFLIKSKKNKLKNYDSGCKDPVVQQVKRLSKNANKDLNINTQDFFREEENLKISEKYLFDKKSQENVKRIEQLIAKTKKGIIRLEKIDKLRSNSMVKSIIECIIKKDEAYGYKNLKFREYWKYINDSYSEVILKMNIIMHSEKEKLCDKYISSFIESASLLSEYLLVVEKILKKEIIAKLEECIEKYDCFFQQKNKACKKYKDKLLIEGVDYDCVLGKLKYFLKYKRNLFKFDQLLDDVESRLVDVLALGDACVVIDEVINRLEVDYSNFSIFSSASSIPVVSRSCSVPGVIMAASGSKETQLNGKTKCAEVADDQQLYVCGSMYTGYIRGGVDKTVRSYFNAKRFQKEFLVCIGKNSDFRLNELKHDIGYLNLIKDPYFKYSADTSARSKGRKIEHPLMTEFIDDVKRLILNVLADITEGVDEHAEIKVYVFVVLRAILNCKDSKGVLFPKEDVYNVFSVKLHDASDKMISCDEFLKHCSDSLSLISCDSNLMEILKCGFFQEDLQANNFSRR